MHSRQIIINKHFNCPICTMYETAVFVYSIFFDNVIYDYHMGMFPYTSKCNMGPFKIVCNMGTIKNLLCVRELWSHLTFFS